MLFYFKDMYNFDTCFKFFPNFPLYFILRYLAVSTCPPWHSYNLICCFRLLCNSHLVCLPCEKLICFSFLMIFVQLRVLYIHMCMCVYKLNTYITEENSYNAIVRASLKC